MVLEATFDVNDTGLPIAILLFFSYLCAIKKGGVTLHFFIFRYLLSRISNYDNT